MQLSSNVETAASAESPPAITMTNGIWRTVNIFIYDLESSRLIARYEVSEPGEHLFNDLVIGHNDDVYITDSTEGSIYKLNLESHHLLRLTPAKSLIYPNGIALSPDGSKLYVAEEGVGIDLVDPQTGGIKRLPHPEDVTTVGIDGLYYHDGYLIATQTDIHPNRVMAYRLAPGLDGIVGATVLERADPRMSSPTEGVVVGDRLYYLANSQQNSFGTDGRIWTHEKLSQTQVLELDLPRDGSH